MRNNILFLIFYIIFALNSNLLSEENNKTLKVGLLAPLSGPYSEIGNSLLYSLQLALEEINDKKVKKFDEEKIVNKIKKYLKNYSLKDTVNLILETEKINKKKIYDLCLKIKNEKNH